MSKTEFSQLLIRKNSINDTLLVSSIINTDRKNFIPQNISHLAYKDIAVPLFTGNRIPAPSDILKALKPALSVNTGKSLVAGIHTGYASALLSGFFDSVYMIETNPANAEKYNSVFSELHTNISAYYGTDLNYFESEGPFDFIFFHGSFKSFSTGLIKNLSDNGIIVFALADRNSFHQLFQVTGTDGNYNFSIIGQVFYPEID